MVKSQVRSAGILAAIVAVFAVFYVVNISGWLIHDDEGTDLYEVWQLQQGKQPGLDYLAEQQPLYLLTGSLLVEVFGRSITPLRLLSAIHILPSALLLSLVIVRYWGLRLAATSLIFILTNGLVFQQARLFRPDPLMFAWELAGLATIILAIKHDRRLWWAMGGVCFGMAFLWKPFGLFPVAGLGLYFVADWLRKRASWQRLLLRGLSFGLPFLIVSLGVSALLYSRLGFYYREAFEQHAQLGLQTTIFSHAGKALAAYLFFFLFNPLFIFILPLWYLNRSRGWPEQPAVQMLTWQLAVPVAFIFITRPIHVRYFLFLVPSLAILLSWQLEIAYSQIGRERPGFPRFAPLLVLLLATIALLYSRPRLPTLLVRKETGTLELAEYVRANTSPEDVVLSDYASVNFHAGRASIYEASVIAIDRIRSQIITAELLISRMEQDDVAMVLLHTNGGNPPPDHLIYLVDFDVFKDYLDRHYRMVMVFDRAGQQIEIYDRI